MFVVVISQPCSWAPSLVLVSCSSSSRLYALPEGFVAAHPGIRLLRGCQVDQQQSQAPLSFGHPTFWPRSKHPRMQVMAGSMFMCCPDVASVLLLVGCGAGVQGCVALQKCCLTITGCVVCRLCCLSQTGQCPVAGADSGWPRRCRIPPLNAGCGDADHWAGDQGGCLAWV
jgi:hypothetical protein